MDISINTPALIFPAISLVMLAYTNRFLALSNRVRSLHDKYIENQTNDKTIHAQIKSIRYRLKLIKHMQTLGVITFIACIFCIFFVYINLLIAANVFFAISLVAFTISLIISLIEVQLSNKAIELQLSDIEGLENPGMIEYFKSKF
ncbi:MAG: DUF2721 domain-containing protein [Bacteroidetes bacterium]|nr:DUF2721 domain-containing protein [Bacteroidota bacterium]